jgi:hypothetical protein
VAIALVHTPVASNTGTNPQLSLACTLPTGLAAGEWVEVAFTCHDGSVTVTTPTGWTVVHAKASDVATTTGHLSYVFGKIADGTEGASVTLTISGATARRLAAVAYSFSGVDAVTPIDVTATDATSTGATTLAAPGATTVTDQAVYVSIASAKDSTGTGAVTPTKPAALTTLTTSSSSVTSTGNVGIGAAYVVKTPAGATGTFTWTVSPSNSDRWTGRGHALRPAAAVTARRFALLGVGV